MSLDGYIEDEHDSFDWTDPALAAQSELMEVFANVWQAADKVVYSTTLEAVSTAKTRLERTFALASVRDLKASPPVI